MTTEKLIEEALKARDKSYCPYSGYAVGAAILCKDGSVYTGCNIENAAFGPTICAERCAIHKAVSEGVTAFEKIAICGGKKGEAPVDYAYPCGVCRQVMQEFTDADAFVVAVGTSPSDYKEFKLKELLPFGFGPDNL